MHLSLQTGEFVSALGPQRAYALLQKYGFSCVDWNFDDLWRPRFDYPDKIDTCPFTRPLDEVMEYFREDLEAQRQYGIRPAQAHAIYPAYNNEEGYDAFIRAVYGRTIEFCHEVGIPYLVIHGISRMYGEDRSEEEVRKQNWDFYSSLIPDLQKTNVTVCMENLFTRSSRNGLHFGHGSDPVEAAEMIDRLNALAGKECFGFCLDTGHLTLLGIDFRRFIPIMGNRIKCIHLNDNDQSGDQHRVPYNGKADWEHFYEEFRKLDYCGTVNFETHTQYSVSRIQDPDFIEPWLAYLSVCGRMMGERMGLS